MRDPNRISRVLAKLAAAWEANPDWRLGQLITNVCRYGSPFDVFYVEDDVFEAELDALLAGHVEKPPHKGWTKDRRGVWVDEYGYDEHGMEESGLHRSQR